MAGQADGSIIVDTEVNPEGFKAGSSELLAAIKSLSSEVKELGKILKEAFNNNNRGIAGTDGYVQQLEATVSSLKQEVQSLQTKVAELQGQLDNLGANKDMKNPVTSMSESAQAAESKINALQAEVLRLKGVVAALQSKLKELATTPVAPAVQTGEAERRVAELEAKIRQLESTLSSIRNNSGTIPAPQADFSAPTQKASALKRSIDAVNGSVANLKPTLDKALGGNAKAMESFKNKAVALDIKIGSLREKLAALGRTKVPTEAYASLERKIAKAEERMIALVNRQDKMAATGVDKNSQAWRNLQYEIAKTTRELNGANAAKQRMESGGLAFTTGAASAEYTQMANQIIAASNALASMQAQAAQTEAKAHGIGAAFRKVGAAVLTAAKTVGSKLVNGLKNALSATKKLIAGNKSYQKSFGGIMSAVKRLGAGLLGVRGVYMILRKAVSAYMEQNEELSNKLNACWSQLGNLLGPIITKVVDLVAKAISYITALLKLIGLSGTSAGKAVKGAGSAAEKAQRYLAGFDELNVMPDKSESGGGGSSDYNFEDAKLPDWLKDVVNQIKSGNWKQAASTLANALNNLVSSVDWAGIGKKFAYYLDGALEFMNTLMKEFDWEALGSSLATGLNEIISGVNWGNLSGMLANGLTGIMKLLTGFFNTLDGAEFGNAIHEFLRGGIDGVDWAGCAGRLSKAISDFIKAIDFKQIGTDLSDIVRTALQTISSAITNFDWRALGQKIADFINGIDWGGIIGDLVTLISDILVGALDLLVGFVENVDWAKLTTDLWNGLVSLVTNIDWGKLISLAFELVGAVLGSCGSLIVTLLDILWELLCTGWDNTKSYFADHIKESGGNIIKGLLKGILDALKSIDKWIRDNIFQPFIDGFCKAFGIHSPSTVMEEQGNFIIEGLLNGITSAWKSITEFIGNALSSLGDSIKEAWSNVVSWTKETWSNVTSNISSAWSNIKSTASSGYNAVKSGVSSAWSQVKSNASSAWSGIKSTMSSAWSGIKSVVTNGYNSVKNGVSNAWSSVRSNTATAWSNIKSVIQNQGWANIGANICQGIGNGLSNGWTWLRNQVTNLARNMLNAAKNALGIHSPSRMFRDAVGLNIGYGIGEGIVASEGSILDSVTGVADAIAEEFNAGTYGENLLPTAEVDGALASFTDKITDSFAALLEKMDAIAKNIGFSAPAFVGSVVPYKASSDSNGHGATTPDDPDGLMAYLLSILAELQALSRNMQRSDDDQRVTKVIIGGREVFQTVVEENNRAIRSYGKSPLKV